MTRSGDDMRQFWDHLRSLAEELPDQNAGFFGPNSIQWMVSRERLLLLGGMRALLLQIAHPKVAQGVADHSNFRADPLGRGKRTFDIVYAMVFGTAETAIRAAARMRAVHIRVQGRLSDPVPALADPCYDAHDPELMTWVYATLVDSSIVAYDLFFPALGHDRWEQFYQESKLFARLCGIDESALPPSLDDLRRWMDALIAREVVTITPTARAVMRALFYGSPLSLISAPLNYMLAAGMLPPRIRQAYGLRWNWPVSVAFAGMVRAVRAVAGCLPERLRLDPHALQAEQRCRRLTALQ
ncbi:MAG: hypothetical protein KatS3mg057_3157 [Herpetosiphonaceae bacterium]|nr:MAG: hypothetical protein KatS3mg057_3157 [Herpetosiphonaceae bacterium]